MLLEKVASASLFFKELQSFAKMSNKRPQSYFRVALPRQSMKSRSNISKTRKSVSSDIQTLRSGLRLVFSTHFSVFGYLMKHSFECLIWLLKALIILREIRGKNSPNYDN